MLQLGIERIGQYPELFRGKRLGVIVSPSGTDRTLRSSADRLRERYDVRTLYGPEHGVRGAALAGEVMEGTARDKRTGLAVYSLYRKDSKHLTEDMLADVDALVYDIQDLGLRFYTYVSTLLYVMEDCARFGRELIVLDRPNPLGGARVEGGLLEEGFESFVGSYEMPIRYGLTAGEFARMANAERKIGCALHIIPMTGWGREQLFYELGYPFLMPSPSIPHFSNALLYAGTCLFEGTNVSEGRGTSDPFALIGAPYIDAEALCDGMSRRGLPGVLFTPAYFTPTAGKHRSEACEGVHLHLTDAKAYSAVRTALELMERIRDMYPERFAFLPPAEDQTRPMIDLLSGSAALREGEPVEELLKRWERQSQTFVERASVYRLY